MYPFIFKPILKEVIWGGTDILPFKGLEPSELKIGESWELSHVEGNYSIVSNGPLEGKSIDSLIETYGEKLLGKKVLTQFGNAFPLLIKFIDARDNLSIQVHPDDILAKKRHQSFGKTEMWYVVKATPDAILYSGFSRQIDAEQYVQRVADNTIMDVLQCYNVKEGDVFFLPAGRVHAIGAGCFIAEIQQTSNITYRIFDYNRKDADGKERELHTELAKDAIDYNVSDDYRTHYQKAIDLPVELVHCKYFTTNLLEINKTIKRDFSTIDSFVVYICMQGSALVTDNNCYKINVQQGQTILIPAETENVNIEPSQNVKFLETYIV